jgi:DNA-binding protein
MIASVGSPISAALWVLLLASATGNCTQPAGLPAWAAPFPGGSASGSYTSDAHVNAVIQHYRRQLNEHAIKATEAGIETAGTVMRATRDRTSCVIKIEEIPTNRTRVTTNCVDEAPKSAVVSMASRAVGAPTPTAASPSAFDFRNARWGQTKQRIIASERIKLQQIPNGPLGGQDDVDHRRFWVFYEFVGDQFARASYALAESYTEPNSYLLATDSLVKGLSEKYGEPVSTVKWMNTLYQSDPLHYGLAIAAGHLVVKNQWELPRTSITQFTNGEKFKVSVVVRYTSREFEGALEQEEKALRKSVY